MKNMILIALALVVLAGLVLVSAFVLVPTAGMAEPRQSRGSTDHSLPRGLVVVIENKAQKDQALDIRALNNPFN
jgi:hypothetical protein